MQQPPSFFHRTLVGLVGYVMEWYEFAVYGFFAATNVELMPREIRCTGLAFSYNLSVGVFGGLTPMVITWLTAYFQSPSAPGYWLAGACLISLLTLLFFVKETHNKTL